MNMYYRYENLDILKNTETPYNVFKKLNIFMIRHGESESNALQAKLKEDGKLLDESLKMEDAKIALTETGKNQSKKLGENLEKYFIENKLNKDETLILVSPFERARQTFEIANEILKFNYEADKIYVLNALREQSYGAFSMISKEIKKQEYEKIYNECQRSTISYFKPQFLGESPADVCDRLFNVMNFIEEYCSNNNIKNVLIFGHGNVNRCMLMNILNLPPEFYDDFQRGANLSIIAVFKGKYVEL